jgi:hypothetical protein
MKTNFIDILLLEKLIVPPSVTGVFTFHGNKWFIIPFTMKSPQKSLLSQINLVHMITYSFLKIHSSIILISTPRSPKPASWNIALFYFCPVQVLEQNTSYKSINLFPLFTMAKRTSAVMVGWYIELSLYEPWTNTKNKIYNHNKVIYFNWKENKTKSILLQLFFHLPYFYHYEGDQQFQYFR